MGEKRGDVDEPEENSAAQTRVDELARELATAINESEAKNRPEMREYAIEMLRDTVAEAVPETAAVGAQGDRPAPLNPLAFGIPLIAVGFLLALIFPPVGLALMALGGLSAGVGLLMGAFSSLRERFRSEKAD